MTRPTDGDHEVEELWWILGGIVCFGIFLPGFMWWLLR
jgi:hypothetical protein